MTEDDRVAAADDVLRLRAENPVEWMMASSSDVPAPAKSRALRYRRNRVGVTLFTRSSVHWAERMVATVVPAIVV